MGCGYSLKINKMEIQPTARVVLTLTTVLSLILHSSAQQLCPTGCFGCQATPRVTTRVLCSGAGLTAFPQLPADIQQTVRELTLRSNSITTITTTDFENFTSLEELDFSNNNLVIIESGSFDNAIALTDLNLAGNRLSNIPDDLFANNAINSLDLSQNRIQNISAATFTGIRGLSTINLQSNFIRRIPDGTFSDLGTIESLDLTNNPFLCDCELRWLPQFRMDTPPLIFMAGTCNAPASLSGMALGTLTEDQFICDCIPGCVNGTCDMSIGECDCDDGYEGSLCSTECPAGSYGSGCLQNCTCVPEQESSPCDHVDGTCHCLPGYNGSNCELECSEGFYGQDCMEVCQCQNGASCDFITGYCNCTIGFIGRFCNMICPPIRYGQDCAEVCSCETGNCHHITGECSCPVGFYGTNCSHNCTEVPDCSSIGRGECSLSTPEQTCGPCLNGYVGEEGDGNTECILCSGAPNCMALNRHPCSAVPNTCGPCFTRHLGEEGDSNGSCFDPCIDGIMNYDETDIDCGGSLCPSCELGDICTGDDDCGTAVCLGTYIHPTGLSYPFDPQFNNTCVEDTIPGNAILQKFKDALQGRENPLSDANPNLDRDTLEDEVREEMELQFEIPMEVRSTQIFELKQEPGDPLYQTYIETDTDEGYDQMIENMHNGKLKGTLLLNREDKKALFNF